MLKYKVIKLKNLTPLHIGTGKENYDFSSGSLHSDTLSSALAAIRANNGKSEDVESFLNSFSISSAFPFYENRFFMPKMQGNIPVTIEGEEEHLMRKQLKKIKFIELDIWNDITSGVHKKVDKNQIQGDFLIDLNNEDFAITSKNYVSQRAAVSRDNTVETAPFFFEWRYFDPKGGLFCLLNCDEKVFKEIFELFEQLGETGLGTDRNVGGGKFEVEESEISLPIIEEPNHMMLLSLFIPQEEELEKLHLNKSKYDILLRGGFMAGSAEEALRHLRKKSIYMFNAGSVFNTTNELIGKVVDLHPKWNDERMHPVFRSGKPFYLPVKIANYE